MISFVLCLALTFGAVFCDGDDKMGYNSDTLSTMLKGYDKMKRPDGGPVKVAVSMFVDYIKWHKNRLSVLVMLRQNWNDARIKSKDDDVRYKACNFIHHIWTPGLFILTAADPKIVDMGLVNLKTNGDILWSKYVHFSTPCIIDAKGMYENDGVANCTVNLEDYTFTTKDVVYHWDGKPVFHEDMADHLVSFTTGETKNKYTSGEYSGLTLNVKVQTKIRKGVISFVDETLFEKMH